MAVGGKANEEHERQNPGHADKNARALDFGKPRVLHFDATDRLFRRPCSRIIDQPEHAKGKQMDAAFDLIVSRDGLNPRISAEPMPDLQPGQVRLRIAHFALTANNITYGVAADQLGYWDFFPTTDQSEGRIPVWGFAEVVASLHSGIDEGSRVYGYLPMSQFVDVEPANVSAAGFVDGSAHRAERAPIYNHYSFCDADPLWRAEDEALIALYRPLFTTSFLLEDLHRDNGYFGATQLVIASASSKTALGLAQLASEDAPENVSVVGLTSPGNAAFCDSLGCYDRVVPYDAVSSLAAEVSAFVDMAGNADVRSAVHTHLGDKLVRSTAVGMTHWKASTGLSGADLPGAKTSFFFAPSYAQDRLKLWGRDGFQARYGKAWERFRPFAQRNTNVERHSGPQEMQRVFSLMRDGQIDPAKGIILSPT